MNNEIRNTIKNKIDQGSSLSDIQKHLHDNHNLAISYMDLRLLVADLDEVSWASKEDEQSEDERPNVTEETNGRCIVNVSSIVRPGYLANGDTTFPSGVKTDWFIDQAGRPKLDVKGDIEPTQEDLISFQAELQNLLQG